MAKSLSSWGNYPQVNQQVNYPAWTDQVKAAASAANQHGWLAYGQGRSYGDVALNEAGLQLVNASLNRFIRFDPASGLLECESGVTLAQILQEFLPRGWFLPVTPGTQFVSIGGAVANDVHGKNHHSAGSFGNHVLSLELFRSEQGWITCSPSENKELFAATIGGLGLTGFIGRVTLRLMAVPGSRMLVENRPFPNLDAGLELLDEYDQKATYTVTWLDCLATGKNMGRGLFSAGEHSAEPGYAHESKNSLSVPFNFPGFALNGMSVRAFNELYYQKGRLKPALESSDYVPFFYPLDGVLRWNRIYGKEGFFQYQCVIPKDNGQEKAVLAEILKRIAKSGSASFLAVLKNFGDIPSLGMLSFPRPGVTLALDFPNKGLETLRFLDSLDDIVMASHGCVYPAKDARMSPKAFKTYFPNWEAFADYMDPQCQSSFWRRVTANS